MEPTWLYVRFRGQVSGPFSAEQMLEKVQGGQISTVHWVSEDQASWVLAKDLGWLFPTAMPGGASQRMRPEAARAAADGLADLAAAVGPAAGPAASTAPAARPASPVVSAPVALDADLAAQARRLKWITIIFVAAAALLIVALTTFVLYRLNE
jgi:hypothetical protein